MNTWPCWWPLWTSGTGLDMVMTQHEQGFGWPFLNVECHNVQCTKSTAFFGLRIERQYSPLWWYRSVWEAGSLQNSKVRSHWRNNWNFKDWVLGHQACAQVRLIRTLETLLLPKNINCLSQSQGWVSFHFQFHRLCWGKPYLTYFRCHILTYSFENGGNNVSPQLQNLYFSSILMELKHFLFVFYSSICLCNAAAVHFQTFTTVFRWNNMTEKSMILYQKGDSVIWFVGLSYQNLILHANWIMLDCTVCDLCGYIDSYILSTVVIKLDHILHHCFFTTNMLKHWRKWFITKL